MTNKKVQKSAKEKINIEDWKKLILKKSEIKGKADTQAILKQMRYGLFN